MRWKAKPLYAAIFVLVAVGLAIGQSAPPKLEFEVVSIRPSASDDPAAQSVAAGLRMDGSQAHFAHTSLMNLMAIAYRVQTNLISGPDWLASQRFDISAKLPDGATTEQIPEMLQSMLAERFQMKIHRESKDTPAYVLELGKSPLKLQQSAPDSDSTNTPGTVSVAAQGSAAGVSINLGNGTSYTFANNQFQFKKFTMDQLATQIARYFNRPVVNQTALKGTYDLTLAVTQQDYYILLVQSAVNAGVTLNPGAMRLLDEGPPDSLFQAFEQQGIHVDSKKVPLDTIVVDSVLQTPTEN